MLKCLPPARKTQCLPTSLWDGTDSLTKPLKMCGTKPQSRWPSLDCVGASMSPSVLSHTALLHSSHSGEKLMSRSRGRLVAFTSARIDQREKIPDRLVPCSTGWSNITRSSSASADMETYSYASAHMKSRGGGSNPQRLITWSRISAISETRRASPSAQLEKRNCRLSETCFFLPRQRRCRGSVSCFLMTKRHEIRTNQIYLQWTIHCRQVHRATLSSRSSLEVEKKPSTSKKSVGRLTSCFVRKVWPEMNQ